MGWRRSVGVLCVAALVACGGDDVDGGGAQAASPAADALVSCGGATFEADRLTGPVTTSLPTGAIEAVDDLGDPVIDPALGWIVVEESDTTIAVLRALEEPDDRGGGDVRTHEARVVRRAAGLREVPDGTWLAAHLGPCTPRRVAGSGLGAADLSLAVPPSPDARSIDLLVRERACASGQPADGRIEVVELVEGAEQVQLWIAVRPQPGGQECPGNPATPFTVELGDPLGDREVVDASVLPPRPLTVGPGSLGPQG